MFTMQVWTICMKKKQTFLEMEERYDELKIKESRHGHWEKIGLRDFEFLILELPQK